MKQLFAARRFINEVSIPTEKRRELKTPLSTGEFHEMSSNAYMGYNVISKVNLRNPKNFTGKL